LKNLTFRKGSLFFPVPGTFIKLPAQLIVNDKEIYELQIDSTGAFFTIPKNERGSPSVLPIRKVIKRGVTVQLRLKGIDCNTPYTRPRK